MEFQLSQQQYRRSFGNSRFTVIDKLGEGAMGSVYQVYDHNTAQHLALKTVSNSNPENLYRLKREFRIRQSIQHNNLVMVHEMLEEDGVWYLTMELVDGTTFAEYLELSPPEHLALHAPRQQSPDLIKTRSMGEPDTPMTAPTTIDNDHPPSLYGAIPPLDSARQERIRESFIQLSQGLFALHEAGLIHRDVKPDNVMVESSGRVILLDFGLVTDTHGRAALDGVESYICGTPLYMAPEQTVRSKVTFASDWYSIGVMLYEAITGGIRPFHGSFYSVMDSKQREFFTRPSALGYRGPPELEQLCLALMRADPELRPSGLEVLSVLGGDSAHPAITHSYHAGTFCGRVEEMARLSSLYSRVKSMGEATCVCVHGESGIGKTALVKEFAGRVASEPGFHVVLHGTCYQDESTPYKGVDGIIDELSQFLRKLSPRDVPLPRNAHLLTQLFPVLRRVEAFANATQRRRESSTAQESRKLAFRALRDLFALLAERREVILVIDDFQWADDDTLQLLSALMRPPDPPSLLMLLTWQTSAVPLFADKLPPGTQYQALGALSAHDTEALTRALLTTGELATLATIVDESQGHPLFIEELVHHARHNEKLDSSKISLEDTIFHRVSRLSAEALTALQLVAVGGAPLDLVSICTAAGTTTREGRSILLDLHQGNYIRLRRHHGTEFAEIFHYRIKKVILAHLSGSVARNLHEQIAYALQQSSHARHELLIYHLENSGQIDQAFEYAIMAAEQASQIFAFARAASLYRTALHLSDAPRVRNQLLPRLAQTLTQAGRGSEAAQVYREACEVEERPQQQFKYRLLMVEQLLVSGRVQDGLETLFDLLRSCNIRYPRSENAALGLIIKSRLFLFLRGTGFRSRPRAEVPVDTQNKLEAYRVASRGLIFTDTFKAASFVIRGLLLALRAGDSAYIEEFMYLESSLRGARGGRDAVKARALHDSAQAIGLERADVKSPALAEFYEGVQAFYKGIDTATAAQLQAAENELQRVGAIWELNTARMFRLICLRRLGAFGLLREAYASYSRDAQERGDVYSETTIRRICNVIWLANDDPVGAIEEIGQTAWVTLEYGFHIQHWSELRARVQIALYQGRVTDAERMNKLIGALRQSRMRFAANIRPEFHWLLCGLSLLVSSQRAPDTNVINVSAADFRTSLQRLDKESHDWVRVIRELMRAADMLRRGSDVTATLTVLRGAEMLAETLRMEFFARAARRRQGELIGGEKGSEWIEQVDEWMRKQGIRNPALMANVVCPRWPAADSG